MAQSHVLDNFGNDTGHGTGEFVHGKIRLCSCKDDKVGFSTFLPERLKGKGLLGTFYVGNSGYQSFSGTSLRALVKADVWCHVADALEAFNKEFVALPSSAMQSASTTAMALAIPIWATSARLFTRTRLPSS